MRLRIAVIGCGYWGPSLVRHFSETPAAEMAICCDRDERRLALMRQRFPHIELMTDADQVFKNPRVDAVAIATPVSTHYALAKQALAAGKHVLVEKPLTSKVSEAEDLIEMA